MDARMPANSVEGEAEAEAGLPVSASPAQAANPSSVPVAGDDRMPMSWGKPAPEKRRISGFCVFPETPRIAGMFLGRMGIYLGVGSAVDVTDIISDILSLISAMGP
jgi:hypothetical protein